MNLCPDSLCLTTQKLERPIISGPLSTTNAEFSSTFPSLCGSFLYEQAQIINAKIKIRTAKAGMLVLSFIMFIYLLSYLC